MLRNPVDVLYSRHSQLVYNGDEDIIDFEASLAAEEKRRNGEMIPGNIRIGKKLLHSEVVKFTEQVKRYFDIFGRTHVHVIIYEDLKKIPQRCIAIRFSFSMWTPIFSQNSKLSIQTNAFASKTATFFYSHRQRQSVHSGK